MCDGIRTPSERSEGCPEPSEDTDGLVDLNRAVGRQVKLLRERAGMTQKELGDRLGYGEDLVSSLERGRRTPQPEFLDAADDLLDAGGLLKATKEDVARAKARSSGSATRHGSGTMRDWRRMRSRSTSTTTTTSPDCSRPRTHPALYEMRNSCSTKRWSNNAWPHAWTARKS
ncbi:hypothetical protein SHIRM173S_07473 [Streptomyces hirsutus]